jgi:hypothetical protein
MFFGKPQCAVLQEGYEGLPVVVCLLDSHGIQAREMARLLELQTDSLSGADAGVSACTNSGNSLASHKPYSFENVCGEQLV